MKKLLGLVIIIAVSTGGCASINTGIDYDRSVDFANYTTAAWELEMLVVAPGSDPVSSLTAKRIMDAVETQMSFRGFEIVDDSVNADLLMVVIVGARDKIRYEKEPQIYDPRIAWCGLRCISSNVHPHTYTEGTLSVDLIDGATGDPVLHGWAIKSITLTDRRNPEKSIDAVVASIFSEFPIPWSESGE